MSFLSIIPQVWADGAHLLLSSIRQAFGPTSLRQSSTTEVTLLTGALKEEPSPPLTTAANLDGRSRPLWMTRGIPPPNPYESHTEPFPAYTTLSPADELAAMHAAHTYTDLLPSPTPIFPPDLSPLNTIRAIHIDQYTDEPISFHETEARDALASALDLAHAGPHPPYLRSHPAFTSPSPLTPSPLTGVISHYITSTHAHLPSSSIRSVSPLQVRRELETCLLLAFAPYVTSEAFRDAAGRNTLVPRMVGEFLEEGVRESRRGGVNQVRDVIECCGALRVKGCEEVLGVWEAWRWVVRCFVGVLVLRDEGRREGM